MVVGDANVGGPYRTQRLDAEAVGQQEVMCGRQSVEAKFKSGSLDTCPVAQHGQDNGFVDGDPARNPVREVLTHDVRVLAKTCGGVPVEPAASLLQFQRGVPVEQGGARGDAGLQQSVNEPVIKVQARRVHRPGSAGLDARPGETEPVGVNAQFLHERGVFRVPVVVVAGDLTGVPVEDPPGLGHERVPTGGPPAVFGDGSLDLVGGGGNPPHKVARKTGEAGLVHEDLSLMAWP